MIDGKNIGFDYVQNAMQGKNWLKNELFKLGKIILTTGRDTANKRMDWNIDKTHSNDAIIITDLKINNDECNIKDWIIKPMRRKSKANIEECLGFRHRDFIEYTSKNGKKQEGYITSLMLEKKQLSFTEPVKKTL